MIKSTQVLTSQTPFKTWHARTKRLALHKTVAFWLALIKAFRLRKLIKLEQKRQRRVLIPQLSAAGVEHEPICAVLHIHALQRCRIYCGRQQRREEMMGEASAQIQMDGQRVIVSALNWQQWCSQRGDIPSEERSLSLDVCMTVCIHLLILTASSQQELYCNNLPVYESKQR